MFAKIRSLIDDLLDRNKLENRMDQEMRFHLNAYTEDLVRTGVPRHEAERRAGIEFGGIESAQEQCRQSRGLRWFDELSQDFRYAGRMLRKYPGFSLIVILSIAIGVSANTTVFNWIEYVTLNPLPLAPQSDRLVTFTTRTQSSEYIASSYSDYKDFKEQSRTLAGLTAFEERPLSFESGEQSQRVWAMLVTGNFFDVVGIHPALGHFFLPEEQVDASNAPPVAVISYDFWRRSLGGQPSIIGQIVKLNRQDVTVIGVAPDGFKGTIVGLSYDVWAPLLQRDRLTGSNGDWITIRKWRGLHVMGRLGPGVSLGQAQSELNIISTRLAKTYPDENAGISAALFPLSETPYGAQSILSKVLYVLLLASFVVLLIVCSNLASLLLVRAAEREKEIGIRLALGAARGRVFRQLTTEGLALSLLAAPVSLAFTFWLSDLLKFFIPEANLPMALTPRLDPNVLIFALILCVVAGLASGLLPAWRGTSIQLNSALKDGGRGLSGGGRNRLRSALTVAEVALALVALIGAGLFLKSFRNITRIDPGFDSDHVLLVSLTPTAPGRKIDEMTQFYDRVKERIKSLPSVRSVSYAEQVPLGLKGGSWEDLEVEGYLPRAEENMRIFRNLIDDDYFQVMGIGLVDGRIFNEQDDRRLWAGKSQTGVAVSAVAIVNQTFVRRFIPGGNAIGHHIHGWGRTLTIVGVVKDSKYASPTEDPQPYLYVPFRQFGGPETDAVLHIAVNSAPANILPAVRREIGSQNSLAYVSYGISLKDYIGAGTFKDKMAATLLMVIALTALILAALGIYGVISHSVTQRINEFGIRMAVGASGSQILRLVVVEGIRLAIMGLIVGVIASLALSHVLNSLLYGVGATDPITILSVSSLLITVALLASAVPAYRASRMDPIKTLRLG